MKEVVRVNVLQTDHDLVENALDARVIETLVVASLHKLIEVTLHILHGDVELLAEGVEEDVEGGNKMRVSGERAQEDHLAQLSALRKRLESLLHRLDGNLQELELVPSPRLCNAIEKGP